MSSERGQEVRRSGGQGSVVIDTLNYLGDFPLAPTRPAEKVNQLLDLLHLTKFGIRNCMRRREDKVTSKPESEPDKSVLP